MKKYLWIILLAVGIMAPSVYGKEDIHTAAGKGNLAAVKNCLENKPELIESRNERKSTPLILASSNGHLSVAAYLIEKGANVDAVNDYGRTSLHYAAGNNHLEIARLLLANHARVSGDASNSYSPLHMAAAEGHLEMVRFLIASGADVNLTDDSGPPLDRAAFSGSVEVIQVLLEAGADIRRANRQGWTALHQAALSGWLQATNLLVERGADVNARDRMGATPLHLALAGGNREAEKVAVFLVEKGAEVNSPFPGRGTPLLGAVQKGMGEAVRVLLKKGAQVDIAENGTGRSLLHLAAISGHGGIVEALLSRGIDVKAKDSRGKTALYYAAKHGNRKTAELIEAAGGLGREEENFGPSPYLQKEMKESEAYIWRLKDRGWVIKTRHHLFVFNNEEHSRRPDEPLLANGFVSAEELRDQDVVAVYSAYHAGKFAKEFIHAIEDDLNRITYIHYINDELQGNRNALYLGGQGHILMNETNKINIAYSEEHASDGGMGWLDYFIQSDGIKFYYSGFPISPLEEHEKTLRYFAKQQPSCDMVFVALSGAGRPGDFKYLDQTLSILKPKMVFIHRPGPFSEDEQKIEEMKRKHSVEIFHFAAEPGERFYYSPKGRQ